MHHRLGRHFETVVLFLRLLLDLQATRTAIVFVIHQLLNMIVARLGHYLGRLVFFPALVGRQLFFLVPFGSDLLLGLLRLVLFRFFRFCGNLFLGQNGLFRPLDFSGLGRSFCGRLCVSGLCSHRLLLGRLSRNFGSNFYRLGCNLFGFLLLGLLRGSFLGLLGFQLAFLLLLGFQQNIGTLDIGTLLTHLHVHRALTTHFQGGGRLTL